MIQSHPRSLALITGASTGIGRALALLMADRHDLILVARNREQLESLATECRQRGAKIAEAWPYDLAEPDVPRHIFDRVKQHGWFVEFLVNNAGFGLHGPFPGADLAGQLAMLQVNCMALTALTGLFLPPMLAENRGRILNVASTAAFQPGPLMAVYFASKAYVLHFSEAIDAEIGKSAVRVCALCPGATESEFRKRSGISDTALFRGGVASAEEVAQAGYAGMLRGQRLIIPGMKNRLLAFGVRFTPRRAVTAVAKRLNTPRAEA
jgi:short-subunit dehydrogenase